MINTLSWNDYATIIQFSDEARRAPIGVAGRMVRMTTENRVRFQHYISSIKNACVVLLAHSLVALLHLAFQ